jgi:hypothetical protein
LNAPDDDQQHAAILEVGHPISTDILGMDIAVDAPPVDSRGVVVDLANRVAIGIREESEGDVSDDMGVHLHTAGGAQLVVDECVVDVESYGVRLTGAHGARDQGHT